MRQSYGSTGRRHAEAERRRCGGGVGGGGKEGGREGGREKLSSQTCKKTDESDFQF